MIPGNPYRNASSILNLFGWTQGSFRDDHGGFCMSMAVQQCWGKIPLADEGWSQIWDADRLLLQILRDNYPECEPMLSIADWNDRPERTFAEVEAMLEKAAIRWDEENVGSLG